MQRHISCNGCRSRSSLHKVGAGATGARLDPQMQSATRRRCLFVYRSLLQCPHSSATKCFRRASAMLQPRFCKVRPPLFSTREFRLLFRIPGPWQAWPARPAHMSVGKLRRCRVSPFSIRRTLSLQGHVAWTNIANYRAAQSTERLCELEQRWPGVVKT